MTLDEINKKLKPCLCGGKVELISLGYPRDTYDIKCLKCNGIWHQNFYSAYEAAESWGMLHDLPNKFSSKILFTLNEVIDIHMTE